MKPTFFVQSQNDDDEFIEAIDKLIHTLVKSYERPDLYVVRINNWFDHKWLNFAGNIRVPYSAVGNTEIFAGISIWKYKKETTLPPFAPNRILSQHFFQAGPGIIEKKVEQPEMHRNYKQRSKLNLNNQLLAYSESGMFVWLSSGTKNIDRASMLVYLTNKDRVGAWYASFNKSERWKVDRTNNVNREILAELFSEHYTSRD